MQLTGIKLRNLLSFEDFTWASPNPRFNTVVGPNGAGKTNLFRAVRCLRDAMNGIVTPWEDATNTSRDLPGYDIEVSVRFNSEREKALLHTFLYAALTDEVAIGSRQAPDGSLLAGFENFGLADFLREVDQEATNVERSSWLFSGTLSVHYLGAQRWQAFYEGSDFLLLLGDPFQSTLVRPGSTRAGNWSLFWSWWASRNQDERNWWVSLDRSGPRPEPPSPRAVLDGPFGANLEVHRPQAVVPAIHRLESLLGERLRPNTTFSARHLFGLLLREGLLIGENVRREVRRYYTLQDLVAPTVDLSTGADLPLFLFSHRNGDQPATERYDWIRDQFRHLTGVDGLTLRKRAVAPEEAALYPDHFILDVIAGREGVALGFQGAGVAQALLTLAEISGGDQVVMLDEPAAHLHPTIQKRLLSLLQEQERSQLIVVTHSQILVSPSALDRIWRLYRDNTGSTQLATAGVIGGSRKAAIEKELRRSSDARGLLFARGVVLVEGETEAGALPVWYRREAGSDFEEGDFALYDAGGDRNFGTLLTYLSNFHVPTAIICDGPAIGEPPDDSRIGRQLREAGHRPPDLSGVGFADRVATLRDYGVFTLAGTATDELEMHPSYAPHIPAAQAAVGGSKVRIAQYVADNHPWPEACKLLRSARSYLLAH